MVALLGEHSAVWPVDRCHTPCWGTCSLVRKVLLALSSKLFSCGKACKGEVCTSVISFDGSGSQGNVPFVTLCGLPVALQLSSSC